MGDYSNFSIGVYGVTSPLALAAITEVVEGYSSEVYSKEDTATSLHRGLNEVRLGTVEECVSFLRELVETGVEDEYGEKQPVEDFCWWVNDEPRYEWMGVVHIHAAGVGDFEGICDSDGDPIISLSVIHEMVSRATDLGALKADVEKLTGAAVVAAYRAAQGKPEEK